MKTTMNVLSLILCFAILFSLCACGSQAQPGTTAAPDATDPTTELNAPLCDGKTLKILAITSSFGLNTTQMLYDIAVAEGATDVVVARLYASGCTLQQHVDNATNNLPGYTYTKNCTGEWTTIEAANMLYGIKDEDWDIIFMQQSAALGGQPYSYGNYVDQLVQYVDENKTNPNARYIWNMTWAYQKDTDQSVYHTVFGGDQMNMYRTIVKTTQDEIVPRTDFAAIIPTGTAVQNARTSFFGDHLTKDTYHLNNLGRVIAGYTLWATITGKPLTEVNVGPVSSHDLPTQLVLSDSDRRVIVECVNAAIENPWSVTQSQNIAP